MRLTIAPLSAPAEARTELVPCFLCGGRDFRPLLTTAQPVDGERLVFAVAECHSCGTVLTNPRPTQALLDRFYPPDYPCHAARPAPWRRGLRRALERAVLRVWYGHPPRPRGFLEAAGTRLAALLGLLLLRRRAQRAGWLPFQGQGRLLDFGCGAGAFLEHMRDLGWAVEGIDVSRTAAERTSWRTGIPVHVGTFPAPGLESASYEAVTMWQALEHVPDPLAVLREAHRLLVPGGALLVAVPNFDSWGRQHFGRDWFPLDVPRHLTHFTPASLRRVAEASAFRVERLRSYGEDGWARRSARVRHHAGPSRGWCWLDWKPITRLVTRWTEWRDRADGLILLARKPIS
jgi:SAM-dependent methyltransferase